MDGRVLAEPDGPRVAVPRLAGAGERGEQMAAQRPVRLVRRHGLGRDRRQRAQRSVDALGLGQRGGVADARAERGRDPQQPAKRR